MQQEVESAAALLPLPRSIHRVSQQCHLLLTFRNVHITPRPAGPTHLSHTIAHSIYQELTRQIIEALKNGRLPWIRPWNTWPLRHNGPRFTGTNSLILCLAADEAGYRSRYWMTRAQGKRYGGRVARGCSGKSNAFPPRFQAATERDEPDLQRAEQFFGAIGARIEESGDAASYSLLSDQGPHPDAPVRLVGGHAACQQSAASPMSEATGSTGHPLRLALTGDTDRPTEPD